MGNMSQACWEHARKLQVLITLNQKEGHAKDDEERAMLAVANLGIDFSTPPEDRPTKREVIEILDDEDDDIVDQLLNEESIQQ